MVFYNISSNNKYLSFVANKISFRKLFIISRLKIMFVSFEFLIILRHTCGIVITNIFHFNCLRGFIELMTYYETANQNALLLQNLIVYKAFLVIMTILPRLCLHVEMSTQLYGSTSMGWDNYSTHIVYSESVTT